MRYLRAPTASLGLALAAAVMPATSPATMLYYGGPVVSNVRVVEVNWGVNVPVDITAGFPAFYGDVVQSDFWTTLVEYATNINGHDGLPGSNQQIGLGSFAGSYTITPANCNGTANCTLTDTQ